MKIFDIIVSKIVQFFLRIFNKKPKVYGIENIDQSTPAIFMSNHEHIYGPVATTIYFPAKTRQWANSMMTEKKACRKYLADAFLIPMAKFKPCIARLIGNIMGGLVSAALRGANTIVSYWDPARAPLSFKNGLDAINNGDNQTIFAQGRYSPQADNFQFMQGYLTLCKMSNKQFGFTPKLYPVAINKDNLTCAIGKPTSLDMSLSYKAEKARINQYLKDRVMLGYIDPQKMASPNDSNITNENSFAS